MEDKEYITDDGAGTIRGNGEAIYRNHIGEKKIIQTYITKA